MLWLVPHRLVRQGVSVNKQEGPGGHKAQAGYGNSNVGKKKRERNAINFILYLKNIINVPKGQTDVETKVKTTQRMPASLTYLLYYLYLLIIPPWCDHCVRTCFSFWNPNIMSLCFYVMSSHLAEITASHVLFSLKGLFRPLSIEKWSEYKKITSIKTPAFKRKRTKTE